MSKHTPGPWVFGEWTIFDSDREAQKRREPYWTLVEGDDCLAMGPFGRKVLNPEYILRGSGYECDGVDFKEADGRLIAAAPEMLTALKLVLSQSCHALPPHVFGEINKIVKKVENGK